MVSSLSTREARRAGARPEGSANRKSVARSFPSGWERFSASPTQKPLSWDVSSSSANLRENLAGERAAGDEQGEKGVCRLSLERAEHTSGVVLASSNPQKGTGIEWKRRSAELWNMDLQDTK